MIFCALPLGVLYDLICNPLGLKDPSLCIIDILQVNLLDNGYQISQLVQSDLIKS